MPTNCGAVREEISEIVATAAEWYIDCASDELSVGQHNHLREWLHDSLQHLAELVQMVRLDTLLLSHIDRARESVRPAREAIVH